jgi:leader peptidase (prepilin peptidase)/N-methyltransferase
MLDHWVWMIPAFLLGACIGSFLNVVIYRMPLGMSVNEPKRSFCPNCKNQIPLRQNLPLISWLVLRGRCAGCKAPITVRYFAVELLTALLFVAVWWMFPPQAALFLWVFVALLVAITFIDAEHLIIPTSLTWGGAGVGLIAAAIWPAFPNLGALPGNWTAGLMRSAIGWAAGYFGLWLVVEAGKLMFGKKELRFRTPTEWILREPEADDEPLLFEIGDEKLPWWDIFFRKSDRLEIEANEIRVDGNMVGAGKLTIRELEIELPNGVIHQLADIRSLDGKASHVVIPREAMGMGDIHLLGMIGAFFGWSGVLFSLFAASIFAILAAIVGRVGFGKPLPFGPFLALGSAAWMFGGWRIWAWYMDFLTPLGSF